jgi:FkbM family methyltransferase
MITWSGTKNWRHTPAVHERAQRGFADMWNSVRHVAKTVVKKPLNALGLDLVRFEPVESPRRIFGPSEAQEFIWMSSLGINTVIDIGAHIGEFAMKIHAIVPDASIFSFEPLEEPFKQLQTNLGSVPKFRAFHFALGDSNTTEAMRRNEFAPSSSLLPMTEAHKKAFPFTVHETRETVEVRRLDDVAGDLCFQDSILVKIDVQGYEDKVILGGERLIARAKLIIVEVSFQTLYERQPLFDEIYRALRSKGFAYSGNLHQLRSPLDGSMLQADAIFLRESSADQD